MKKVMNILLFVIICLVTGFVSSRFQVDSILNWYPKLNKPSLTPPNYIFPIAWSFLYLCMGISIGLIVSGKSQNKVFIFKIFIFQLILNFTWSLAFFYLQNPLLGLVNIILLEIVIIYYAFETYRVNKISALLFIPYILWVGFASYLNYYIYVNN